MREDKAMKVVLLAVIGIAIASPGLAQAPVRDTKPKLTPIRLTSGETPAKLRRIKLLSPEAAKPAPYIYKAPLATRPIKTW